MLYIDFENLRKDHPEFREVWEALSGWAQNHPQAKYIVPLFLAHEVGHVDVEELNEALDVLVNRNRFVQKYRVLHPTTRTFLPGRWDSPLQVPERIPDRNQDMVETQEAAVV